MQYSSVQGDTLRTAFLEVAPVAVEELARNLDRLLAEGGASLVLDLGTLRYVQSSVLGCLICFAQDAERAGKTVVVRADPAICGLIRSTAPTCFRFEPLAAPEDGAPEESVLDRLGLRPGALRAYPRPGDRKEVFAWIHEVLRVVEEGDAMVIRAPEDIDFGFTVLFGDELQDYIANLKVRKRDAGTGRLVVDFSGIGNLEDGVLANYVLPASRVAARAGVRLALRGLRASQAAFLEQALGGQVAFDLA